MICWSKETKMVCGLFLILFFSLEGALIDYVKPAIGKPESQGVRNIDFIYLINLDERAEKYNLSMQQLAPYKIVPYRFSGVNGWKLPIETINGVGVQFQRGMTPLLATTFEKRKGTGQIVESHEFMGENGKTFFAHHMPLGAIGCSLSHISVLEDAYQSGYETIWVMEDDIEVLENPHQISDLIDELDSLVGRENWDVLFTDRDYRLNGNEYLIASGAAERPDMDCSFSSRYRKEYTQTEVINSHFRKISARFGTTSMIIRRSGIIKLLDFWKTHNIFLPCDLENYLDVKIQRYGLTFDLVSNLLNALSDNAFPNYEKNIQQEG